MTWRVARSLEVLREELNAHAPGRSTASDGSIGDAAHATRSSDHNPWITVDGVGVVRARDFTHDPAHGLDCHDLAFGLTEMILEDAHPALGPGAYVIWNRRIFSTARAGEGWRPYTGSNPHDHHLHLSVALDPAGFDSARPWHIYTEEDDDMFTDTHAKTLERIEANQRRSLENDRRILDRLAADAAIRVKLNRLIKQGRATRADLEEVLEALPDPE